MKQIPGLPPSEEAALSSPIGSNDSGTKEAKLFALGLSEDQFRKKSAENEHVRNERFKDHFETIAILTLWVIAALFLIVGVTWFWHLIMPDNWHWLKADQIAKLQNIVTGGILTSIAAGHVKKRLG